MSFPDEHVTCTSCNAVVPWSPSCINCGENLPPKPKRQPQIEASEELHVNQGAQVQVLEVAEPEILPEEEPEGRLAKYLLWRVKALELAEQGKISHEAFQKHYTDYMLKTRQIIELYTDIGDEVVEAGEILQDTKRLVEEKQEERARGELSTEGFMREFTRLRGVIEKVSDSIMRLRAKRNSLGVGGSTEEDVVKLKEIQRNLHHYKIVFSSIVTALNAPAEMQGPVIFDLSEMIELFEASVDWEYEHVEPEVEPEPQNELVTEIEAIAETEKIAEPELFIEPEPVFQPELELEPQVEQVFEPELELELTADPIEEAQPEPATEEPPEEKDPVYDELIKAVKGHNHEIKRLLKAVRLHDNVLLLGPHGEGKTETLLQLKNQLGGVYLHCDEDVTQRELVAGYNPPAGGDAVHNGLLMRIVHEEEEAPILYLDSVMKLKPRTQGILFEAMNNKTFTNPVDGKQYSLPDEFTVVAASNLDNTVQDTPDPEFLDRFGKTIIWNKTPIESIQALLARYALPEDVFNFAVWIKQEVDRMRYLVPINVRNLIKFAKEYKAYRDHYEDEAELKQLAVDRLLKMRVINPFGVEEYEEAYQRVMEYTWDKP
ncbi:MAG: AAA family ATPase [Candidatus Bathyarchaeota archaeon]|nr:AAA family ATPase [Candidatus Bathyarchaeota archaeon]